MLIDDAAVVIVVLLGLSDDFGPRLPFRLGRLPLDFHIQRDNFSFYFPLGTSIVISIVLTIVVRPAERDARRRTT